MKNTKQVVAHINHTFFQGSETFIYNYISHQETYHPICLAWEFVNQKQFPFPEKDTHLLSSDRFSFGWFRNQIFKKFSGIDPTLKTFFFNRDVRLIHAHFGPNGVYALNIKKTLKIPLITSFYGYDMSGHSTIKEWKRGYETLFSEGDLFLAEGTHMKSKLVGIGCPKDKIEIQRLAIPIDYINCVPRRPKEDNNNVMLVFSGRFVEKKGIIHALKAVRDLKKRFNNLEFCLLGDGPLRQEIERFIAIHNMEKFVKLLGFLPHHDNIKEMQKGDIFVHPSITTSDGETEGGAPTVILEAQAMGMPVVSTFHADIPNIVVPGKSALLSEEGDCTMLANNISYLLENQEVWYEMGLAGRAFVEKYHDINKEVALLEDKYNDVLKNLT